MTKLERIGFEVRKRREARGLSQDELAKMSGMARQYIGLVERGQANISLEKLFSICASLSVSPSQLFASLDGEKQWKE